MPKFLNNRLLPRSGVDAPSLKRAGTILFVGVAQFAFFFALAEIYYPGYDVSVQTISDLGATCEERRLQVRPALVRHIQRLRRHPRNRAASHRLLPLEGFWVQGPHPLRRARGDRLHRDRDTQRELRGRARLLLRLHVLLRRRPGSFRVQGGEGPCSPTSRPPPESSPSLPSSSTGPTPTLGSAREGWRG